MSVPTNIATAFERARRYQSLAQEMLKATEGDPTLSPECPPYETQYGAPHVFAQSADLADIAGFYRACGLAAPAKERLDHLSAELEFMSFLALKEAYGLYTENSDGVASIREMQKKFVSDHLGRWVPAFAMRYEPRDGPKARELREWVESEVRALGADPSQVRAIDLGPSIGVEDTFECGGGSCDIS